MALFPRVLSSRAFGKLALVAGGRPRDAIVHYQEAVRIKADCAEVHLNWGNALDALGAHEEAMVHYQGALRIKPDYVEAHYNLGDTLAKQGRLKEAERHFEEALRLKPDLSQAREYIRLVEKLLHQKDGRDEPVKP